MKPNMANLELGLFRGGNEGEWKTEKLTRVVTKRGSDPEGLLGRDLGSQAMVMVDALLQGLRKEKKRNGNKMKK